MFMHVEIFISLLHYMYNKYCYLFIYFFIIFCYNVIFLCEIYTISWFIVFLTSIISACIHEIFRPSLRNPWKTRLWNWNFTSRTGDSLTFGYIENLVDPIGINEKCRKYGKWLVKFDFGRTIYNTGWETTEWVSERRVCVGNFSKWVSPRSIIYRGSRLHDL